jgi:hypothetical protein
MRSSTIPTCRVHRVLGPKYLVHLLPVVLGEIDDLKRAGRLEAFSVVPQ